VSSKQHQTDPAGGEAVINDTLRKSGRISSHQSELTSSPSTSLIRNNTSTELQVHGGNPRMEVF